MQKLIDEIKKTSGDMARRGWAESNGGNISLRLNEDRHQAFNVFPPKSGQVKLPRASLKLPASVFWLPAPEDFYATSKSRLKKIPGLSRLTRKANHTSCSGAMNRRVLRLQSFRRICCRIAGSKRRPATSRSHLYILTRTALLPLLMQLPVWIQKV